MTSTEIMARLRHMARNWDGSPEFMGLHGAGKHLRRLADRIEAEAKASGTLLSEELRFAGVREELDKALRRAENAERDDAEWRKANMTRREAITEWQQRADKVERERNEARKERGSYKSVAEHNFAAAKKAEGERDEARDEIKKLAERVSSLQAANNDMCRERSDAFHTQQANLESVYRISLNLSYADITKLQERVKELEGLLGGVVDAKDYPEWMRNFRVTDPNDIKRTYFLTGAAEERMRLRRRFADPRPQAAKQEPPDTGGCYPRLCFACDCGRTYRIKRAKSGDGPSQWVVCLAGPEERYE